MLERKNHYNVLDLTPHNAIGFTQFKSYQLKLKWHYGPGCPKRGNPEFKRGGTAWISELIADNFF